MENERFFSDHIDFPQGLFPPQTLTFFVWFLIFNIEFDFFVKKAKEKFSIVLFIMGVGEGANFCMGTRVKRQKRTYKFMMDFMDFGGGILLFER